MNKIAFFVFLTMGFLCFTLENDLYAQGVFELKGKAINLTVGKSSGVSFEMREMKDTQGQIAMSMYRAYGQFDNKTLFGAFDLFGRKLRTCKKKMCLQFVGEISFSEMGNWPRGVKTTFVLTVMVSANGKKAIAVYHIGPTPSMDFTQYGTLELKMKKKTRKHK